jgi:ATP-binding cassette subfamily B protein
VILYGVLPAVMLLSVSLFEVETREPENFIIFSAVCLKLCDPLLTAMVFFADMTCLALSAVRIHEAMQQQPLIKPSTETMISDNTIELQNVNFADNEMQVLFDISCQMKPGTMTALIGRSGSGKSAITRLIARFWDVGRGLITLGGTPLPQIRAEDLLDRISVVFQDVYLFHDTIAEKATREGIEEAAKAARCHDFIMNLPDGNDTMVGEGGNTRSGGEKQRISIARVILKDAPIVLLDEAMPSLDSQNEVLIQEAISQLAQHKTLVVIAHRLQSIMGADEIIVLARGHALWREQQQARGWKCILN